MPIYPIGIIDEPTSDGARFSIPPQNGRTMPKPGDHVTVWNHFNPPQGPLAKLTGEITEASETTGTLIIHQTEIDPEWPQSIHPFGMGNPIYMAAAPRSFIPDTAREWASPEEFALMNELAKDHERQAGIPPSGAGFARVRRDDPEEDNNFEDCDGFIWPGGPYNDPLE